MLSIHYKSSVLDLDEKWILNTFIICFMQILESSMTSVKDFILNLNKNAYLKNLDKFYLSCLEIVF